MNIFITIIGFCFIVAGLGNLSGTHSVKQLYRDMRLNPDLRFVAGIIELVGGIGLMMEWMKFAALGLAVFMAIACIIHLYVRDVWYKTLPSFVLMCITFTIFMQS